MNGVNRIERSKRRIAAMYSEPLGGRNGGTSTQKNIVYNHMVEGSSIWRQRITHMPPLASQCSVSMHVVVVV